MRTRIGICFIIFGFFITSYHFIQWEVGRSAAKELTVDELEIYTQKNNQLPKTVPKPKIQPQTPSSDIPYQEAEKVATLVIPSIGQKFSVYWGANEKVLTKGVGMFVSHLTTAPDGGGHTVLSGHRDTVFYRLGELKEGDLLSVEYSDAIYTYIVKKIWITDAEDRSVIVKKQSPTLTLTTCYPFDYIGNAPNRYIVQAEFLTKE